MAPPPVLQLLAHPLRWRLVQELVASDRTVRELTDRVEEPQNLVSYHLRQLHDGGLVVRHRSSADRRDIYYAVDLVQCREEFARLRALHPALWPGAPPPSPKGASASGRCSSARGTARARRSPRR